MMTSVQLRVAGLTVALALTATARLHLEQLRSSSGPTLLVLIVVDQMRFDYLDRAGSVVQHGLKRLLAEGAVFDRAAYPYATTVTCAGHATISTGTFPVTHGIISNEWWSRAEGRRILCTEDATAISVPYLGDPEKSSHGARRLRVPTLGDRLRASNQGSQVVTLSMKARSAVMMAGKAGTAVTWFVDATHGWATSSAFARQPIPQVRASIATTPVERDRTQIWSPINGPSFKGLDDAAGERPKRGWSAAFPHPLSGAPGTPDWQFYELWKCSPYADDFLASMALSQVSSLRLGQRGAVDLLGVSFSGLDCVGHDFGPDSAEVHDTVLRLDRTLGTLFSTLDSVVGRSNYVVALSADHGVSPIPEQLRAQGRDAGRVLAPEVRQVAEAAMQAVFGPGPHIASVIPPYINFASATRALLERKPDAAKLVIDAVSKMPGVLRVMATRGLERRTTSSDPIERATALSYHPDESGDVVYLLKPYWLNGDSSAASHGTPHDYDRRVPLVLMGPRIKPGRYSAVVSPADIAPTFASLVKVSLPGADGRPLADALIKP